MRMVDIDAFLRDLWNEPCDVNDLSSNWSKSTFGYSYELVEQVAERQDIIEKE